MSDFLDAVAALLARAPLDAPAPAAAEGSLLAPPMTALAASSRSFDAVYGGAGLLPRLAEEAEAAGNAALAGMLRGLAEGIADEALRPPAPPEAVRRFTGFVYPVI